jgi:hypothetical protein
MCKNKQLEQVTHSCSIFVEKLPMKYFRSILALSTTISNSDRDGTFSKKHFLKLE